MKGFFKGLGAVVLITLVLLAAAYLAVFFIWGGVALSALMSPFLAWIFRACSVLAVVMLVLGCFKGSRMFAAQTLWVMSYLMGFALWMRSLLVLFVLANTFWIIIGLLFGLVGVIPLAIGAAMFKEAWDVAGQLAYATFLTIAVRWFALYFAAKANKQLA